MKSITIIILFVCWVKSSDVGETIKDKVFSERKQSDPPSGELLGVPVAVIFEGASGKNKSFNVNVSTVAKSDDSVSQHELKLADASTQSPEKNTNISLVTSEIPEKIQSVEINLNKSKNESMNSTDSLSPIAHNSKLAKADINTKSAYNTQMEIQIPVAVIYDPEPEDLSSPDQTKSSRRRQSRRRDDKIKSHLNLHQRATQEKQNKEEAMDKLAKRIRERDPVVPIVEMENYVFSHSGAFHYSYEGGDGTKAFEKGELKSVDENVGESVVGGFSYVGKDGNEYSLSYTADENGYQPVGAHLPTPPPIPPAIARALKYLATKTTPEPVTEAS